MQRESAPVIREVNRSQVRLSNRRRKRKWPCRSIGSSKLLLIIFWEFIISCSTWLTLTNTIFILERDDREEEGSTVSYIQIVISIMTISSPITSLLAEVVISRYKFVSHSLKAMWLLSLITSITTLCVPVEKSIVYLTSLVILPQLLLTGGYFATAVPLGIDQINGGSKDNISAFLQWLYWAYFSGGAISAILASVFYKYTSFLTSEARMILSLLPVLLLSVGLILDFCFHHKLVKEPVTVNPVSLIFKILKYAAKHKYPVQRSAFTYCENEQPTRLDYGKSKYGGPFTTEQVEDVKTFWRLLLVILAISMLYIPLKAPGSITLTNFQAPVCNAIQPPSIIMYGIPLYELLIYPCLRNRSPSILKSVGIGAVAVILTSLYGVTAEVMRQLITSGPVECMFTKMVPESETIPINILVGLTILLLFKSTTEFICAQAPYNMNGILVGLSLTILYLLLALVALLPFTWSSTLDTSTCGIWFYLTTLVLAVVSSALLGLVIRWYKGRERDEIPPSRNLVEEVYHKYQTQATQE